MKTNNIGSTQYAYKPPSPPAKPGKVFDTSVADVYKTPVDKFTPTSMKGVADPGKIKELWNEFDYMADSVRKLVSSAIGIEDRSGQGWWAKRLQNVKLSDVDRAKAQELISEDGYFGVKKTTERIMSFAKALVGSGASEKEIEAMRAAVQKGFDEVAKMFGGFDKLPQVTKDTYDAIMKAFDDWKGGASTGADTE